VRKDCETEEKKRTKEKKIIIKERKTKERL
jgi:hypothetical protein